MLDCEEKKGHNCEEKKGHLILIKCQRITKVLLKWENNLKIVLGEFIV